MCWKRYILTIGVFLALLLTAFPAGASGETDDFSFTLNGKPIDPLWRTLRSLGIDGGEVLVSLDRVTMLMDRVESYAFVGNVEKDGKLYVERNGKRQLIGIKTGRSYGGDKNTPVDPFAGMTPSDMDSVRGICFNDVLSKHAVKLLVHVNCSKVFFTVTENAATGDGRTFPAIPDKTMFLDLLERSSNGIADYSYLGALESLVYLRLRTPSGPAFDAALIKGGARLVHLDLGMKTVKNISMLTNLHELRQLDLSYNDQLTDITFVRELAQLERLMIGGTRVSDLSPIQDLNHIAFVDANGGVVSRLPRENAPSLKKLKIVGAHLTKDAVTAFKQANPHCQVSHGWNETLQAALADVDGMRVRSGGTCHIRPEDGKTLFEIKEADKVKNIISRIIIEPSKSDFHCMCCGDPSFEFYKGDDLVVTLGFHHGSGLRWMGGEWPGDGLLTDDSGDFMCTFLDKHGIKEPLATRLENRKKEKSAARRRALYGRLLPDDVKARLSKAEKAEEALDAFIEGEKSKPKRVALGLRIIGCDHGSWNQSNLLDPIILALLDNKTPSGRSGMTSNVSLEQENAISASDIVEAIEKNKDDAMLLRGAAKWFFGERKYDSIPEDRMEDILPLIAKHGLTHPRQINRRWTLQSLKELNNSNATAILRSVLAGEIEADSLNPEEDMEPSGMFQFRPGDSDVPDECSDQAYAALILAESGNKEILPEVRMLLKSEKIQESKEILEKAIGLLDKQK